VVVRLIPPGSRRTIVGRLTDRDPLPGGLPAKVEFFNRSSKHPGEEFYDTTFTGTFVGINFTAAKFFNCRFVNCEFRGGTKIDRARFSFCAYARADFTKIETRWITVDGPRPATPFWADKMDPDEFIDD
jgi:hypothetical protein